MNKRDIIYAIISGLAVAWIGMDFFPQYGLLFFIVLPVLSVLGLLLCLPAGRQATGRWQKPIFIGQVGKFGLVGAFADVVDIKVFQILFLFAPLPLFLKGISFFIATAIKYLANKHWTFLTQGISVQDGPAFAKGSGVAKEMVQFFTVAIIGLLINVVAFYCATQIIGPQFGISVELWTELGIIFSALVVAIWNFLGYKFIVFKK
jgi:putative flippase GtrA